MEQKFSNNSLDLQILQEFCEHEGESVLYRKGDQLEREGAPARWFGYVTQGCFKYVRKSGLVGVIISNKQPLIGERCIRSTFHR